MNKNKHDKHLAGLAVDLNALLRTRPALPDRVNLPTAAWQRCESLHRRMWLAHNRGWRHTSRRTLEDLRNSLVQLQAELTNADRLLANHPPQAKVQSPREIYRDLIAIREEFGNVTCDRHEHTVAVTTESIELEGIYLGEFEIRLDLNNLSTGLPLSYRIIALDPNPSTPNDCVTHPHVQDERLCEGEGHHTIRHALQQGRLLDFFVIVATLLRNYNSGSPFVSLAAWNGLSCSDCGSSIPEDEHYTCEKCETTLCEECHYTCPDCGYTYCSECVIRCEDCEQSHCNACLRLCSRCQTDTCQACLDENERCSHCHDQEHKNDDKESVADGEFASTFSDVAEIQPDSVGQTVVPA